MNKWAELAAVETVVTETEEEFGEDPLLPDVRSLIDGVRAGLEDVRSSLAGEAELGCPSEEAIDMVRKLVQCELDERTLHF